MSLITWPGLTVKLWVQPTNSYFLADRTNGRAIATLFCLSSVVVCL